MKKALGVFLMTAMAFGAFAEEPVADVKIAEFSGNASVEWGVDLDSGTTGFKNGYEVDLKLNLLNNGTKSTTGDGVWGELVLKTEKDTYIGWENGGDSAQVGDSYISANTGMMNRGNGANGLNLKVYVDVAKIHLGPAYIGIERDNTTTGKLKMDAAIRSADDDQAKWLDDVGPKDYSEGIVAGFENDMFKVDLDIRSKPYTSLKNSKELTYISKIDDKDESGTVTEGDVIHFANGKTRTVEAGDELINMNVATVENYPRVFDFEANDSTYYYTDNYAAALEGEFKGVENLSVKAGVSYNFAKNYQAQKADKEKTSIGIPQHTMGYSASLGYKLALDDTFFIRPQVGFAGTTTFGQNLAETEYVTSDANMAAGLLFGWGEIGQDKDAGVYYLDDDMAKKVSPGVGVVAYIPFATTSKVTPKNGDEKKPTTYGDVAARIMPSLYTGELIPGLTAAAYGDIVVPNSGKNEGDKEYNNFAGVEKPATPMAFAFGAKYAIPVDEMTITPQFGLRFANAAYVEYEIKEKDDPVFADMGDQANKTEASDDGLRKAGNFMNMKLGVDVAGLIDNTTLSVTWQTNNILNDESKETKNPAKLGTLNFKAKIAL